MLDYQRDALPNDVLDAVHKTYGRTIRPAQNGRFMLWNVGSSRPPTIGFTTRDDAEIVARTFVQLHGGEINVIEVLSLTSMRPGSSRSCTRHV